MYSQTALDRIRNYSNQKKKITNREKKAKLFTTLQRRIELREFFKRWRSFTRTLELTIRGSMWSKQNGGASEHGQFKTRTQNYHSESMLKSHNRNQLFKLFNGMREQIWKEQQSAKSAK
jgi:hypothetical protein